MSGRLKLKISCIDLIHTVDPCLRLCSWQSGSDCLHVLILCPLSRHSPHIVGFKHSILVSLLVFLGLPSCLLDLGGSILSCTQICPPSIAHDHQMEQYIQHTPPGGTYRVVIRTIVVLLLTLLLITAHAWGHGRPSIWIQFHMQDIIFKSTTCWVLSEETW